jgi:hypothetical protein
MNKFDRKYSQVIARNMAIITTPIILLGFFIFLLSGLSFVGILMLIACLVIVFISSARILLMGVLQETQEELTSISGIGLSYSIRWDEIQCFESKNKRVIARFLDKRNPRLLFGLVTGKRYTWEGGQTRDIANELNKRLKLYKNDN